MQELDDGRAQGMGAAASLHHVLEITLPMLLVIVHEYIRHTALPGSAPKMSDASGRGYCGGRDSLSIFKFEIRDEIDDQKRRFGSLKACGSHGAASEVGCVIRKSSRLRARECDAPGFRS